MTTPRVLTPDEITAHFSGRQLTAEATMYLDRHARRYARALRILNDLRNMTEAAPARILDVGPSFLTELVKQNFPVDTIAALGLAGEKRRGGHLPVEVNLDGVELYNFDLNESTRRERWISCTPFDLVIMAELIEHLYCAPTHVLAFMRSLMHPGAFLIIQTPNAASTVNRLSLLMGRNPYHPIRENAENPGHFHEYTKRELVSLAIKTGFEVHSFSYENYFARLNGVEKTYGVIQGIMPPSWRDGMTAALRGQ